MSRRHLALLGLSALSIAVMVVVGRHPTPQQHLTLAPVIERGTEVLKAGDVVGQAATRLSPEEVAKLDQDIQANLALGPAASAADQAYVEGILARLERFAPLQPKPSIRAVDTGVPNAFALPGGTILVTTGMIQLCENEAELAEVIAHEMGHHKLGHPLARIQYERAARRLGGPILSDLASLGYALYARGYSARDEEEADRQGLDMAAKAEYHPQAAQRLMARMQAGRAADPAPATVADEAISAGEVALRDYFATHPPFPQRIQKLERARKELGLNVDRQSWFVGRKNHAERIAANQRQEPSDFRTGPLS